MHNLIFIDKKSYRNSVENIASSASNNYKKVCYISFNDTRHVIIEMLNSIKVDVNKFIVVDASGQVKKQEISNITYIVNTPDLFNIYLLIRNLIKGEEINAVLIDSISALIYKHDQLPLKEMLTNLLLEIGAFRCDSLVLAFKEHEDHEVLRHLSPFIGRSTFL